MRCAMGIEARQVDELAINIDPIQAGGRLTADAMKAVIAYGDGYRSATTAANPTGSTISASRPLQSSTRMQRPGSAWTRCGQFPVPVAGSRPWPRHT